MTTTVRNERGHEVDRLRKEVERHVFETAGPMTISIGVVDSKECSQMHILYRDVDEALYEAKRAGKNRVHKSEK